MPDLETRIAEWRKMMISSGVDVQACREIETHLREMMDEFRRAGATEEDAFQRAVVQVGSPPDIASEFNKLRPSMWLPAKIMIALGTGLALVVAAPLIAVAGWNAESVLAQTHMFTLTLGYIVALLTGALGICFVCQRLFAGFSPERSRSVTRVAHKFDCTAAGLLAIGILLGLVWVRVQDIRSRPWRAAMAKMREELKDAHVGLITRKVGEPIKLSTAQNLLLSPMWASRPLPPVLPPWFDGEAQGVIMRNSLQAEAWFQTGKETASFCVLLWLVLIMAVRDSRSLDERGIHLLNILSITLVALACFGLFLLPAVLSVAFFLIGLAPERWFRRSTSLRQCISPDTCKCVGPARGRATSGV